MAKEITKDMMLPEVLACDPRVEPLLMSVGMHCLQCPSHQFETLEEAAAVHGIGGDELCMALNKYISEHPLEENN